MTDAPISRRYRAFGLRIVSEVRLPALAPRSAHDCSASDADLVVRRTSLPGDPAALDDATRVRGGPDGTDLYRRGDELWWDYPPHGRLRVRAGRRLDLDLAADTDETTTQHLVLGPGVYSALVQRARAVFHASAVAVDGAAVVFVGERGRGKSTAAAACYAAGHEALADDVVALTLAGDRPGVSPAYPRLRVGTDVASALDCPIAGPGATGGEVALDASDRFRDRQTPLAAVYLLEPTADAPRTESLPPRDACFELVRSAYLLASEDPTASDLGDHQRACATVADAVPVRRLYRPTSLATLDALVQVVEADVRQHAAAGDR